MRCALPTLLLSLPLLTGGCMTHQLWTGSQVNTWNEPAPNPNLHVFHDGKSDNLLVVYDELSERRDTVKTRAYFLNPNQPPPPPRVQPLFVDLGKVADLMSVPVFCVIPTNPPELFCTVEDVNSASFRISSNGRETGPFHLPVYDDGVGTVEKVALTPVAVTLDLTVIGGLVALCYFSPSVPFSPSASSGH